MRRLCLAVLIAAFAFHYPLVATAQDRVPPAPPELRKLHALLVVDTNTNLGESVVIDGERVESVLRHGIPRDRLDLKVLKGVEVTPTQILGYFKELKVTRSDALFFFYAGHGAIDVDQGHFLFLQEGKGGNFYRATLREAMVRKGAGLTVIVTDCCSERLKLKKKRAIEAPLPHASAVSPLMRCLFFQHRGLVDITAATDNCSWGDEHEGGLFTKSFGRLLSGAKFSELDTDRNGFVSWKEFYTRLDGDTERTFVRWAATARGQGEKIEQKSQKPHPFALSEGGVEGVTLLNETIKPLRYQFRWSADASWESATIPGGDGRAHVPPRGGRAGSALEVKMEGETAQTMKAGKTYRFTDKRKTRAVIDDDPDKN